MKKVKKMYEHEKKVTLEWINADKKDIPFSYVMSNPINNTDNFHNMVENILDSEIPKLKNNIVLHDLVLYTVIEKLNTVQTVENVLSYIKGNKVKTVQDITFKNGEVRIKCLT